MQSRDDNRARKEVELGGADAVEKTSYLAGAELGEGGSGGGGGGPQDRHLDLVTASTDPGGGANPMAWIGIGLLLVVLAMWLAGLVF